VSSPQTSPVTLCASDRRSVSVYRSLVQISPPRCPWCYDQAAYSHNGGSNWHTCLFASNFAAHLAGRIMKICMPTWRRTTGVAQFKELPEKVSFLTPCITVNPKTIYPQLRVHREKGSKQTFGRRPSFSLSLLKHGPWNQLRCAQLRKFG
jgi:hypothetical protein